MLQGCFAEFAKVTGIVVGRGKAGLTIDAALDDVLGDAGQVDARQASHERSTRLLRDCQHAHIRDGEL